MQRSILQKLGAYARPANTGVQAMGGHEVTNKKVAKQQIRELLRQKSRESGTSPSGGERCWWLMVEFGRTVEKWA